MRQKPLNDAMATATVFSPRKQLSHRQKRRIEKRRQKAACQKTRQQDISTGMTITPLRGFFMALLFLGIPTVSLGSLCFSLLQNNLQLTQSNDELQKIATEITVEVDLLEEEIDLLREQAGVPKSDIESKGQHDRQRDTQSKDLTNSQNDGLVDALVFRGGPANAVDSADLLESARRQIPKLTQALNSAIKPALADALAEEAAYPDAQPLVGQIDISSEFGVRANPFGGISYEIHEGIDFAGEHGDIVAAAGDGTVTAAGVNGGYGISVTIDHGNGYETLYGHLSEKRVTAGDQVKRGQIIGYVGSTGRSSGPHLHYSIYKDEVAINPRLLLKLPEQALEETAEGGSKEDFQERLEGTFTERSNRRG